MWDKKATILLTTVAFILFISQNGIRADTNDVYITIAYCPDYFSTLGAVISVDSTTGNYTLVGKFAWPKNAFLGCAALYDPIVTFDTTTSYLYLDVTEDFGEVITVDVANAKVVTNTQPKDEFFIGYENMAYNGTSLLGLSPTGTRNGEGAYQYGILSPTNGEYIALNNIPYKALMDDSHYLSDGIYWVQASYDTRPPNEWCDPKNDAALCLLAINAMTGDLINSTLANTYTVYKYSQTPNSNGTVLCFAYGFESLCNDPYNDYLFLNLNLSSATAEPVACISHGTVIQMDEWISSFSSDNTKLAQGSCYGGESQFLVFDSSDGSTLLNSNLDGLAKMLGAIDGQMFFWSVDFSYS